VPSARTGAAIVGVGRTPYYRRGQSYPQTQIELACKAILAAVEDAGLSVDDIDGFSYYTGGLDSALIAQTLGIPEIKFTTTLTGGGGGSAGSLGVAAAAIKSGLASTVVCIRSMQQGQARAGAAFAPSNPNSKVAAESDFYLTSGLVGPGQMFAMLARRHMHLYGTTREDFAAIVLAFRHHAMTRPDALRKSELTLEAYLASPLLADPLCRYDFCVENDVAGAVILTSSERAADLRHPVVEVIGSEHGGLGRWGQAETWFEMPDEYFASSGHRSIGKRLFGKAGITAKDVDVALIYDNFSSNVLLQIEDYGLCEIGGGGKFVRSGAIRWPDGEIPVNTHGGQLSEGFLAGMSHIIEGVEQLRGTAINQVKDAKIALVTGGAAAIPTSGAVLAR
jgi:acetyl-CoA acetyltransferase